MTRRLWVPLHGITISLQEVYTMLFIGIDVAADKHDYCVLSPDGKILCEGSFLNSRDGFEDFLRTAERCRLFKDGDGFKIGMESTGHYSTNILAFLKAKGFNITLFNALTVKNYITSKTLRRTHTDKLSAKHIARMLATNDFDSVCRQHNPLDHLKSFTRALYRLDKEIQPLKNWHRRLIRLLFPEAIGFFGKIDTPTALAVLEAFPSARDIAACNITKLTSILSAASKGHFKREKADTLKHLAKLSIAVYDQGSAFELRQTVRRIKFLEQQKSDFHAEIKSIMLELNSPITSIKGIGYILGAVILSEIGDIRNFATPNKLLAFAGAEPSIYDSGKYSADKTPMAKRGSRYLRKALYLATVKAFILSPSFRAYINLKRAQGKHFYTALSHGMKKLCRVIFAVLTTNMPYVEPKSN